MQVNQHSAQFVSPSSEDYGSRKNYQPSTTATFKIPATPLKLVEAQIGNYLAKAQRITHDQKIEGYAALYDLKQRLLFEGEFVRSKRNGFGQQYNLQGKLVFEGYFKEDKYNGWGQSNVYTGEYKDGFYNGYGMLSTQNSYYQGYFHRGLQNGRGIKFIGPQMIPFYPIKNVNSFLQQCIKSNSEIMKRYKIQQIYTGEWKQGNKHGFGRLWKKDYQYSGQFVYDKPENFAADIAREVQTCMKIGRQ